MSSCSFADELSFGPSVNQCRRVFDFTVLFEDAFFQLLPSCLFILVGAFRLAALRRCPAKVGRGALHTIKLVALAAFAALHLALLVYMCRGGTDKTALSIPAAVVSYLASVGLVVLSHLEHVRSYRPSFLLGFYLVITLPLKAATARTYWLIEAGSVLASTTLAVVLVQIIIIVLEQCSKRKCFLRQSHNVSPEETAGALSRSLFSWLNRLLVTGYRRPIGADHLRIVDASLASDKMAARFSRLHASKDYGPMGLIGMSFRCLGFYALTPAIPRLCMTGFFYSQSFLAAALISYLEDSGSASDNFGYGLIGASFLVYGGIAVSTGWYWHLSYKCVTKMRGGLVEVIVSKMLRLRQEKGVESKVLTLIIGDVHRIITASAFVHELWVAPIETSIGIWLLWRQVGPASLSVLAVAALSMAASVYIGKHIAGQQGEWLAATEKRLEATKSMLSSLKAIKMMSASQRVRSAIEKLRVLEFAASKMYRTLLVASVLSSFTTVTLAPVLVFGTYIGSAGRSADFDTARMFSSLILIALVAHPLLTLFQVIPNMGAALGCAPRVEDFLRKEEMADTRRLNQTRTQSDGNHETKGGDFTLNIEEKERNSESTTGSVILSMRGADLGWDDRVLLKNVNLEVARGQHIAITGPVGCGKSLLLQAILGEVAPKAGSVSLADVSVGYCTQGAWLENLSVRDNAFRCAPDDDAWRDRVIEACALRELINAELPGASIGSGGARISGGERQRLTLARAVASRPAVLLLDDVFSAIDGSTRRVIFDRLFGPKGIVTEQRITVVQIVQDQKIARLADAAFKIDQDGQLVPLRFLSDEGAKATREGTQVADESPAEQSDKDADDSSTEKKEFADPASIKDRDVYKVYFKSVGVLHLAVFLLATMSFSVALKFPDIWVRWWTEDARLEIPTKRTGYWVGLYAFLGTLPLVVICVGVSHLMLKIVPISGVGLHGKLLRAVLNATFVFISGIDSGSIINRFNQDLMLVDLKLPLDLLNTATYAFTVVVQAVLVAVAAIYVIAVLPVLFGALWILQHFYLRTSKRLRQLDLETKSDLHTKVSESYRGIVTIRAHAWQTIFRREFWEKLDRSQEPLYLLWMVQTWLQLVLNMIVAGLAVTVAGVAVATRHKTSAGAIGVAFLNLVTLGEGLTHLLHSWTSLETSLGAIARIEAFEKDTPVEKDVADSIDVPPEWPSTGSVSFSHVWASYHPEHDEPTWSLQDISLQIQPGEKIAVCGRSGSGKSTFLMSLLALIDAPRGTIRLDGVDISRVPRDLLRSKYLVISQERFLYGDTIREMLDADGTLSDETINSVLRECAILDKVNDCGGLSGSLQDASISVGETQLLALARTILQAGAAKGGVVLFDEATSSIDTGTEERIMKLMGENLKGKTIISVLHRLEAALEHDRILVLEKGRVAHFGTPAEVIEASELFSPYRKRSGDSRLGPIIPNT